ncbi:transformer-2 protein [Nematocida sp. AWRm78]|nr:transformer-2 protein [Nematocida sp. AWRm79]KAI5183459.1 transformer-2 protein [Nematocida sp. AWRm78]
MNSQEGPNSHKTPEGEQSNRERQEPERGYRPPLNRYRNKNYSRYGDRGSRYEDYPGYRDRRVDNGSVYAPRGYKTYSSTAYPDERYRRDSRKGYELPPRRRYGRPDRPESTWNSYYNENRSRPYYKKRLPPTEQKPVNVLSIFGIDTKATEEELKQWLCEKLGNSLSFIKAELILDKYTGYSRGYAFVYFDTVENATAAKEKITDQAMNGSVVRVEYSITPAGHAKKEDSKMEGKEGEMAKVAEESAEKAQSEEAQGESITKKEEGSEINTAEKQKDE